ncbi:acetyl-CoA carboxylase biotin carboxyl carrier protein [Candidatus Kirkpatrickella diaphorinae]|uniref:Biotin carboxyl carrier protein of acetyl-CoA carboxylase n=1 Tax=Candidatus Kirkpatrickella diaphorinae TaxID=2984322 RepID=A0ABY6GHA4_9PROT|nr:acetyl-CoA carboxylase biotin carboxyl carrier protein [Candidatus Kirkpatrickella diaphorinae]UYH50679.1 acetyl-CoA carboxylase biotin carboxyl carrier protein [Candidatus Kirkpatrickella diaphorinae]
MSRMQVDGDAIRALADLLNETGLSEIEIAEKEHRIRVARAVAPLAQAVAAPVATVSGGAPAATASTPASAADHPGAVKSPMVGVVYLASDPSAPPYMQVGQSVTEGQTILLIEAMKTFNQVKAPRAGKVTRILVSNGDPVEFGEPLAIIE